MSRPPTPHAEPEVLAAQNRRAIAGGPPEGWLSDAQAEDLMIDVAIRSASIWAERAFLGSAGETPEHAENAVSACVLDMMEEAQRAADFMNATPEQRIRMEAGRNDVFDRHLAYLRAFAISEGGNA